MRKHIFELIAMAVVILISTACTEHHQMSQKEKEVDSLMNAAYKEHDYKRIITLADLHQQSGSLSDMKAGYWRGYAYQRLREIPIAEKEWKSTLELEIGNREDLEYYAKTANRLASLLFVKFDYQGTIRVAFPAIEVMKKNDYTLNADYANLHTYIGNCQLKLGHPDEAASNYALAYDHYLKVTKANDEIADYTSSIIGIIYIINSYLQTNDFQKANDWTSRFATMLQAYREHPMADYDFIDKQTARLNFYRGCTLESLGHPEEALEAYQQAAKTRYANTSQGQIEATNYLMAAKRWDEAADKYEVMEQLIRQYDMKMTLDNIHTYLLPKYLANIRANRMDSAAAVGQWICNSLDTAIVWERQNAEAEMATIYDMRKRDSDAAKQKASLYYHLFWAMVVALICVILGFVLFIRKRCNIIK